MYNPLLLKLNTAFKQQLEKIDVKYPGTLQNLQFLNDGHQLQQIINELIDDKIYYPESCVISFQVFNTEYKINAGKLDDAEKENIDSIYKRLSYDKRTLIAIDAIVYPDIITTRVSAMLDLTAAIKNYHEAYAMVLNRDNAFEIYQKYVKEN